MRYLAVLLGLVIFVGSVFTGYIQYQTPVWRDQVQSLIIEAQEIPRTWESWSALAKKAKIELPVFYPFSHIAPVFSAVAKVLEDYEAKPQIEIHTTDHLIPSETVESLHLYIDNLQASLHKLQRAIEHFPEDFIPDSHQEVYREHKDRLFQILSFSRDMDTLQASLDHWARGKSTILLLLQNQHEPRSTGGFAGSMVLFTFTEAGITWDFADVYALDRAVPDAAQLPAPDFFHDLSQTISLRDANAWPDFPTSAQTYQHFLEASGKKAPDAVVGINLNIIEDLMTQVGTIDLEPWYLTAKSDNFDLVLQFLVESKIAGRYATKAPVELFASRLLKALPEHLTWEWVAGKIPDWIKAKDLMVYTRYEPLQKRIEHYGLAGKFEVDPATNDFLHLDFVSIGANKSENFVWTRLSHDSQIAPSGKVQNTLRIKRTHALKAGELEQALGLESLPPNIQSLWNGELAWKLGYGQNRTVLRMWVPQDATLLTERTVSGPINITTDSKMPEYQVWEVPLFIGSGESLETQITYEIKIPGGSPTWRPYRFELIGTPGRDEKTKWMKTISTTRPAQMEVLTPETLGPWTQVTNQSVGVDVRFE